MVEIKNKLRLVKHILKAIISKKGCIIHNVFNAKNENAQCVLVCYLDYTIYGGDKVANLKHTNVAEFNEIVNLFSQKGYIVDICSWDCDLIFPFNCKNRYSLIFGFGDSFRKATKLCPDAISIIYMTENPYWYSLKMESERLDYLYKRRGIKLQLQRTGIYYKKNDENNCDAILCLGKREYLSYTGKPIREIFPTALSNDDFFIDDLSRSQKNFLVLGSVGFVHKGLDILLDVIRNHPDWTLYLAGYNNLGEVLTSLNMTLPCNVVDCGFINIASAQCLAIMKKCAAILQFSCSEANSTSVLTGMRFGLVPIVSKGSACDKFSQYCLFADGYFMQDIEEVMNRFVSMDSDTVRDLSNEIKSYADKMFNIEQFKIEFSRAIDELLEEVER